MRRMLSRHSQCNRPRWGFTLVELLVVIAIIGMLVALLIPAVAAARARARQTTCASNMRQVGQAIVNYESSKQRYPGYVEPLVAVGGSPPKRFLMWQAGEQEPYFVGSYFTPAPNDSRQESLVAWSAHILPQVDRQDIYDVLVDGNASNAQRILKPIEIYVCPDHTDVTSAEGGAGLSYVVNTGGWDWNGTAFNGVDNNNQGDSKDNGLFHNRVYTDQKSRMSGIRDGAATTLMLSENLNKSSIYSWFGVTPEAPSNLPSGMEPDALGEQKFGMVWVATLEPAMDCDGSYSQFPMNNDGDAIDWPASQPCFARPFSGHPGGSVNVIFADGHGDRLSPNIEYRVYQQLLTTNGAKCIDPGVEADNSPTDGIRDIRAQPLLSESDFN